MEIRSSIVRDVCYRENDKSEFEPYKEWHFIESKITSSDTDDGGAHYEAVMQNDATGQFYKAYYNDWDFYWEYSDFEESEEEGDNEGRTIDNGQTMEIYPVKARVVTTTIYE